jgi:acyl-CoA thioester hydrolase
MEHVFYKGQVLWSQIDANMHLRHSAYADFAAQARLALLEKTGFSSALFHQLHIGPILFREESIYLREVALNDTISVTCELSKMRVDGSRWSFTQEIYRSDHIKAAIIHVDGAWLDTKERKLATLPADLVVRFHQIPKRVNFIEEPIPQK